MTVLLLRLHVNHLAVKTYPYGSKVRWVRGQSSKVTNRVIAGAVAGLIIGSLSTIIGIRLSGLDVSDTATFNEMVRHVVLFAGVWP